MAKGIGINTAAPVITSGGQSQRAFLNLIAQTAKARQSKAKNDKSAKLATGTFDDLRKKLENAHYDDQEYLQGKLTNLEDRWAELVVENKQDPFQIGAKGHREIDQQLNELTRQALRSGTYKKNSEKVGTGKFNNNDLANWTEWESLVDLESDTRLSSSPFQPLLKEPEEMVEAPSPRIEILKRFQGLFKVDTNTDGTRTLDGEQTDIVLKMLNEEFPDNNFTMEDAQSITSTSAKKTKASAKSGSKKISSQDAIKTIIDRIDAGDSTAGTSLKLFDSKFGGNTDAFSIRKVGNKYVALVPPTKEALDKAAENGIEAKRDEFVYENRAALEKALASENTGASLKQIAEVLRKQAAPKSGNRRQELLNKYGINKGAPNLIQPPKGFIP